MPLLLDTKMSDTFANKLDTEHLVQSQPRPFSPSQTMTRGRGVISRDHSTHYLIKRRKKENKTKEEAPKLSAKEAFRAFVYDTIKNVFGLSTTDGEYNVNVDNVFPLMKVLELDTKDEAIIDMIHEACIESYGNIDLDEFDKTVMDQRKRVKGDEFEQDIRSAFRLIDVDGDGVITTQDLYQLMMGIGEMLTDEELTALLKPADNDGDGQISYKDFKFFLTGELDEEKLEPEIDEDEEQTEQEANEEEETEDKNESEAPKAEVEEEKEVPLTQEEIEAREAWEKKKRKSLLWGFSQTIADQSKEKEKAEAERKAKEQKAKEEKARQEKAEEEERARQEKAKEEEAKEAIKNESNDPKPVTSVTVNYLESIKEEGGQNEEKSDNQKQDEALRDKMETPTRRRRPFSSTTTADSGIDAHDADDIQNELNERTDSVTDDGFVSRTQSAKSRFTHDKSRASSARSNFTSRPSTAGSRYDDLEESFQGDDELSQPCSRRSGRRPSISTTGEMEKDEDFEGSTVIEDGEFKSPLTNRQHEFLENSKEQQTYCYAGKFIEPEPEPVIINLKDTIQSLQNRLERDGDISDDDTLDLESVIQYDPNEITPRINLSRLKSKTNAKAVPVLKRSVSASRLRTFKKMEHLILKRQNTDPRLDVGFIKAANERATRERKQGRQQDVQKRNTNGLFCSHISIDLNVAENEEKPKVSAQQTTSRKLLKRPQTAMTLKEAEKLKIVYGKNYETRQNMCNSNRDVKIIDLSNMVSIDTDNYEKPGLVNRHHGYKSVLPLGRVLSGHKNKINNGNGIVLNSMSRKLERISCLNQMTNSKQFQRPQNISHQENSNKQAIVNLQIPEFSCRRNQLQRTQSVRFPSRSWSTIRTPIY